MRRIRKLSREQKTAIVCQAMFAGRSVNETAKKLQTTIPQIRRIERRLINKLGLHQTAKHQTYPFTADDY